MKRIKTSGHFSLGSERLKNFVRIVKEGVEFENFDAMPYVESLAWVSVKVRRPNQRKEKWNYKRHSSTGDKSNISESKNSNESKFEGFGEEDFGKEINILLNKKSIDQMHTFMVKQKHSYILICLLQLLIWETNKVYFISYS